jgi:hypothetical protein
LRWLPGQWHVSRWEGRYRATGTQSIHRAASGSLGSYPGSNRACRSWHDDLSASAVWTEDSSWLLEEHSMSAWFSLTHICRSTLALISSGGRNAQDSWRIRTSLGWNKKQGGWSIVL